MLRVCLAIASCLGLVIVRRREEPINVLLLNRVRTCELGAKVVRRLANAFGWTWRGRLAMLGRRRARRFFLVIVTTRRFWYILRIGTLVLWVPWHIVILNLLCRRWGALPRGRGLRLHTAVVTLGFLARTSVLICVISVRVVLLRGGSSSGTLLVWTMVLGH